MIWELCRFLDWQNGAKLIKGRDDIVEIKAGSNLRVEMEIPIKSVENFNVCWKPNQHVLLEMSGYMEPEVRYRQRSIWSEILKKSF